ncbi:MAG: rhodanese-related sulfurtransferase [Alphaproteobacteria bacterium]|nr:rhodanese-related sulfurtransferase [Alphaproteobacteria bacterium]
MNYHIAAFYQFTSIADCAALRAQLLAAFAPLELCGTLLIAPEGINGTLAGKGQQPVEQMLTILAQTSGMSLSEVKFSEASEKPFNKLKLRLKREIITFQQPQADPNKIVGTYVTPKDWNKLIADPDVTVLDTRNLYETAIGTFAGAVDPQIAQFTDFAAYVRSKLNPAKNKKIAMFCTGGIRCEKASAFMRAEGFEEVYHLKGGILKYLEEVAPTESLWHGACYVFDKRVAVEHGLKPGAYSMCFCCGYPLTTEDQAHPRYEAGVSCAHCHDLSSEADKARFRTRHQQMTRQDASLHGNHQA